MTSGTFHVMSIRDQFHLLFHVRLEARSFNVSNLNLPIDRWTIILIRAFSTLWTTFDTYPL